jgi:putative PIN family toxin of toxin-antitoxin system
MILDGLKQDKFKLIISERLIEEILVVAENSEFGFTEYEKEEIRDLLKEKAEIVESTEKVSLCRDPKDNIVLECASAGMPDFIVTGDKDLLSIKEFNNIPIITPKEFIKLLK